MDRDIPLKEKRRQSRRKCYRIAAGVSVLFLIIVIIYLVGGSSVKASDLRFGKAGRGRIESSVSASGKVVPLYEQAVVSPVSTKILEVYCEEGDFLEAGQSMLRLDLASAETELRRAGDEVSMKQNEIEHTMLGNATKLTDLEMRIRAKEMSVSHLMAEVANERRLDSIGSGTGDRIREAELAYETARLELEQMRTQLVNERKSTDAAYRSKRLEGNISRRNLTEMQHTLDDARICAPHQGTVTYINRNLGTSIAAGEKLATVADLSHFKILGEMPETNATKLSAGSEVNIRVNRLTLKGHISGISPQSQNGMVEFSVLLENDATQGLRPGLRTDLNVVFDILDDVIRIPNGPYFQGAGSYVMFVKTADNRLERRNVTLGDSNFDYVEVKSGISEGEEVVISDMSIYKEKRQLKIK